MVYGIRISRLLSPEKKDLTIEVVHGDGQTVVFSIETEATVLADALVEHSIVENQQGPYGLYILSVDGEPADETKQEWWCLTRNGEALLTGASETPISDNETYELTFTVGYDEF